MVLLYSSHDPYLGGKDYLPQSWFLPFIQGAPNQNLLVQMAKYNSENKQMSSHVCKAKMRFFGKIFLSFNCLSTILQLFVYNYVSK